MKKFIVLFLSLVLVLGLGVGCNKTDETLNNNADIFFESLSNVEDNELRISLCAEEVTTNSEYIEKKLTATITPYDNFVAQAINWNIAWENGPEEDISDYLTITPDSSNNLVLYVRCYKAFSDYSALITCRVGAVKSNCRVLFKNNEINVTFNPDESNLSNKVKQYNINGEVVNIYHIPHDNTLDSTTYVFKVNASDMFGDDVTNHSFDLRRVNVYGSIVCDSFFTAFPEATSLSVEFGSDLFSPGYSISLSDFKIMDIGYSSPLRDLEITICVYKNLDIGNKFGDSLGFTIEEYFDGSIPYIEFIVEDTVTNLEYKLCVTPITYVDNITLPEEIEIQ